MSLTPYALSYGAPAVVRGGAYLFTKRRKIEAGGRFLWNNRKGIGMAARKIQGAYRRYRRSRKVRINRSIGQRPGSGTTKRNVAFDQENSEGTRVFIVDEVTAMNRTTTNEINERQRQIVNFRGFKFCATFKNLQAAGILMGNLAILAPKGVNTAPSTTDFFRSYENSVSRAKDFGNGLTANEFHCLPINADKYKVLKHWRFRLAPEGVRNCGNDKYYKTMQFYYKLNRQLRWDDLNVCQTPIYIVRWWDNLGTASLAGPTLNVCNTQVRVINYWREPK